MGTTAPELYVLVSVLPALYIIADGLALIIFVIDCCPFIR